LRFYPRDLAASFIRKYSSILGQASVRFAEELCARDDRGEPLDIDYITETTGYLIRSAKSLKSYATLSRLANCIDQDDYQIYIDYADGLLLSVVELKEELDL
jgi:hypothetical protein